MLICEYNPAKGRSCADSVAPVCVFVESHSQFALPCACLSFWQEIAFRSYVHEGRSSRSDISFMHIKVLYELNIYLGAHSSISSLAALPKKIKPDRFGNRGGCTACPTHLVPSLPVGKVSQWQMAQIRFVYRPSSRSETSREETCWWSYCRFFFFPPQRPFNQSDLIFRLFIIFLIFISSLPLRNSGPLCACILSVMRSSCRYCALPSPDQWYIRWLPVLLLIIFFRLPFPQRSHVQTARCVCVFGIRVTH